MPMPMQSGGMDMQEIAPAQHQSQGSAGALPQSNAPAAPQFGPTYNNGAVASYYPEGQYPRYMGHNQQWVNPMARTFRPAGHGASGLAGGFQKLRRGGGGCVS